MTWHPRLFPRTAAFLTGIGVASVLHAAGVLDPAPDWTEEAPVVSRLIEQGFAAHTARNLWRAADRYCAASRLGSVEAQYRLGRVLLELPGPAVHNQGRTVLALAAQRGHEKAAWLLDGQPVAEQMPACLLREPADTAWVDPVEAVVPHEVVDRYIAALPPDKRSHAQTIRRLAPRYGVDFRLALAIARAESNLNAQAVSARNAMGLMQLVPETAARFGVRNAFDPVQNVRGGLAYLSWLLDRFRGNVELASAAYNAGEGAVDRHGGVPPYVETREYVQRILRFYRSPVHARPGAV